LEVKIFHNISLDGREGEQRGREYHISEKDYIINDNFQSMNESETSMRFFILMDDGRPFKGPKGEFHSFEYRTT
jgi:hypothetical protein